METKEKMLDDIISYAEQQKSLAEKMLDDIISYGEQQKSLAKEQAECQYCHFDENLTVLMEQFSTPDNDLEIKFSCGGGEVYIIVRKGIETANLLTKARFCPYCGRKIS